MSRSMGSAAGVAGLLAQQTTSVYTWLLDMTLDGGNAYVCNNGENITSTALGGSREYVSYPFEITMPNDVSNRPITAKLRIGNVAQTDYGAKPYGPIWYIRLATEPIPIKVGIVLADTPNTLEAGTWEYELRNVSYDALIIEGDLILSLVFDEPWPVHTMSPLYCPLMFTPIPVTAGDSDVYDPDGGAGWDKKTKSPRRRRR